MRLSGDFGNDDSDDDESKTMSLRLAPDVTRSISMPATTGSRRPSIIVTEDPEKPNSKTASAITSLIGAANSFVFEKVSDMCYSLLLEEACGGLS